MKDHTTFHIGGKADLMLEPESEDQIGKILAYAREAAIPIYYLGRGSNLLVSDSGLRGVVVHLGNRFSEISLAGEEEIRCGAGVPLARLCYFAYSHGLSGLEFAWGIPGSVGGGIYMNAGAYGGELKDVLIETRHIGEDGKPGSLKGDQLGMAYRRSAYTGTARCITYGVFRLKKGDPAQIRARMDDYFARRKAKQPLEYGSAGSTFKRPVGGYASQLIDQCGLKGFRIGDAQVSEKHAGFVINRGNATAGEVLELIEQIRSRVAGQTGILLEPEVKILE